MQGWGEIFQPSADNDANHKRASMLGEGGRGTGKGAARMPAANHKRSKLGEGGRVGVKPSAVLAAERLSERMDRLKSDSDPMIRTVNAFAPCE